MNVPLAERMRPKSLKDYFGQEHLVGCKGSLTQLIENGIFSSLIFWGPPGKGKTNLASLLADEKIALYINFQQSILGENKPDKLLVKMNILEIYLVVKVQFYL